ncbi:MAG: hypothetical protein IJG97_01530 [Bacilli bacterium]|nr:hypothetical protein [Bacilli bacterium]
MIIDKDNIKILLIILILGLGIGYSYINSDLNINGTAQVNSANWDVHWANIQVTNGSVSGTSVVSAPTISNSTTVSYSIILNIPGEYYEFTVDAVNGGTIDAMIDSMEFKLNGSTIVNPPEYLNYTITYSDGEQLEEKHELKANTTEKYKIRVEYRTDIELSQIPASNQNLLLSFGVMYRQATEDAVHKPYYMYTTDYTTEGDDINASYITNKYDNYEDIINITGHIFFQRHLIKNNKISETYLGIVRNNEVYYVRAYMDSSDIFTLNKIALNNAYGSSNCEEGSDAFGAYYSCDDDYTGVTVYDFGKIVGGTEPEYYFEFQVVGSGGYCQGSW